MVRPMVIIADDHALVAEALKVQLQPEYSVVEIVADGRSLISVATELKSEIILIDLGMPLLNGIDAGWELKKLLPETKFIVLTMSEDTEVAQLSSFPREL